MSQTRGLMVIGFLALGLTPVVIMGDIDLSGEANLAVAVVIGLGAIIGALSSISGT